MRHAENSLRGVRHALAVGARFVEVDVQLTRDRVPVLHHDRDLQRLAGRSEPMGALAYEDVAGLHFAGEPICRLEDCVALVTNAGATLFVELKRVSVETFGADAVLDSLLPVLEAGGTGVELISFREDLLDAARLRSSTPVGLILEAWSEASLASARSLAPDWVFCNVNKVPPDVAVLPDLGARWAVYVADDADSVRAWWSRGADLVETDAIDRLLAVNG